MVVQFTVFNSFHSSNPANLRRCFEVCILFARDQCKLSEIVCFSTAFWLVLFFCDCSCLPTESKFCKLDSWIQGYWILTNIIGQLLYVFGLGMGRNLNTKLISSPTLPSLWFMSQDHMIAPAMNPQRTSRLFMAVCAIFVGSSCGRYFGTSMACKSHWKGSFLSMDFVSYGMHEWSPNSK